MAPEVAEHFDVSNAAVLRKRTMVVAVIATESGTLPTGLAYSPGDAITTNSDGSQGVVAPSIWADDYIPVPGVPNTFQKRATVAATRYWGPTRPFTTLEGPHLLQTGGWVFEGGHDDRWPVRDRFVHDNFVVVKPANSRVERDRKVEALAEILHEEWRRPLLVSGLNVFHPRLREARDHAWTMRHNGADRVDLANTAFHDLPIFWQDENRAEARQVLEVVAPLVLDGIPFGREIIDELGSAVQDDWIRRNVDRLTPEQMVDWPAMTEVDRDRCRTNVRWAMMLVAPMTVESFVRVWSATGGWLEVGPAPDKLENIALPPDARGFQVFDRIRMTSLDAEGSSITVTSNPSPVYVPGAVSRRFNRTRDGVGPVVHITAEEGDSILQFADGASAFDGGSFQLVAPSPPTRVVKAPESPGLG